MSRPSNSTRPLLGRSRRRMMRSSVDLPEPELPTMPRVSPGRTARSTSLTARLAAGARTAAALEGLRDPWTRDQRLRHVRRPAASSGPRAPGPTGSIRRLLGAALEAVRAAVGEAAARRQGEGEGIWPGIDKLACTVRTVGVARSSAWV